MVFVSMKATLMVVEHFFLLDGGVFVDVDLVRQDRQTYSTYS